MKERRIFIKSTVAIFSMLFLVVIFYKFFDQSIARWFFKEPHGLAFQLSKTMIAHLFSSTTLLAITFIVLIIGYIKGTYGKPGSARPWLYFAYVYILAFALRTILKFVLARYRPELYFSNNLYGFHFFSMKWIYNSMPSGHAVAAFSVFASLATIFKRCWLTIVLFIIAVCVALSRLIIGAHFASDVIFGAYIGCLSAYWINAIYPARREISM